MELFKKRGDIEAQIIAHSRVLEEAYVAANNELKEVLKGKLEDIDEGPRVCSPRTVSRGRVREWLVLRRDG